MNAQQDPARHIRRREYYRALRRKRPESEIIGLVTPGLAGEDSGFSALHWACSQGAPTSVVAKLVDLFPQAATSNGQGDGYGDFDPKRGGIIEVPVFVACSNFSEHCLETIELLIDAYPGCLHGSTNHVPLFHLCVRLDNSEEVLNLRRLVYKRSVDAGFPIMDTQDLGGFYPIHHLGQSRNVELIKEWLEDSPPGRFVNEQFPCNTLLHIAVQDMLYTGHNPEMVEYLVRRFPDAVTTTNEKGQLPIHLALWHQDRDLLVREHPWTLLQTDIDGKIPIDRVQTEIDRIYRLNEELGDLEDDEDSWVDRAYAESLEYRGEMSYLLDILSKRVFPALEHEVMGVLQYHEVPSELFDHVLGYALPYYSGSGLHSN
jgi:hypothetical protein